MSRWVAWDPRRAALGLALVGLSVIGVAGCTSEQATPGTTLAPVSSSGAAVSQDPVSAADTSRTSVTKTSNEPTPNTDRSGPGEFPATSVDLGESTTPGSYAEQAADAESALIAYRGYRAAIDLSLTDPTVDWTSEIRTYSADPAASDWLNFLQRPAIQTGRASGSTTISPTVAAVEPALVTIHDCVDTTAVVFVNAEGENLLSPDQPGSYRRHPVTTQVAKYEDSRWLVSFITEDYAARC